MYIICLILHLIVRKRFLTYLSDILVYSIFNEINLRNDADIFLKNQILKNQ
jgi:hypothetical protein